MTDSSGLPTDDDMMVAYGNHLITTNKTTADIQADKAQQWLALLRRF